ncbi:MAG: hypothetical protein GH155_06645 [Spirochaeta sp.]|nr:hypothetical protein [Spirochaeta sp.]
MFNVAIIYAPQKSELKGLAEIIKDAFNTKNFKVNIKSASQAGIPDIAAAEILILAANSSGSTPIHSDFSEILRALNGVNLAGRLAGFCTVNTSDTLKAFKEVLNDSEAVIGPELFLSAKGEKERKAEIKSWIEELSGKFEEMTQKYGI